MISALEEKLTGPAPDDMVDFDEETSEMRVDIEHDMDDASGALLDPDMVKKAREEELTWLRKEGVYERVPAESWDGPLLKWKWLDVNKGDADHPKIRSRMVAKEVKKAKPLHEQLGGSDVFSATPPIEAVYSLLSMFMTRNQTSRKRMASWVISRAHFMGRAVRELYMRLPDEDLVQPGDQGPMIGKLCRSMYGTQDASKIFQDDYSQWLIQHGGTFCPLCPALFQFKDRGLGGLVHGDDFLVVGEHKDLMWLDEIFQSEVYSQVGITFG